MTPKRWKQIDELAQSALERAGDERAEFLDQACADDDSLRHEVESQIAYQQQASKFLEEPAFKQAADLMSESQTEIESMDGRTISHYSILRKLGAGGMGEVYLAQDTTLSRKVAIKFLSRNSVAGEQAKKRLVREARAAAALDHPHICAVYEVGEEAGYSFIVMQYVEGETLASRIERQPIELRETLDIAVQIADALAEAHSHRIIHRDIKPQNVMLTASRHVKVLDFGLARVVREGSLIDSAAETESVPGLVMGTVPYMSPEQVRGEALDGRSDIFSFGTVLYEMLSGKSPFQAESIGGTMSSILTKEPAPLARYASEVPDELQRMVRKALSKDKDARYQTIKDLLIDLRELKQELEFEAKLERSIDPEIRDRRSATPEQTESDGRPETETAPRQTAHTDASFITHTTPSSIVVIGEIKRHKLGVSLAVAALALAGISYSIYKFVGHKSAANLQSMKITRLTNSGKVGSASISPDGKYVAYSTFDEAGQSSLWVRHVATMSNVQIVPPAGVDVELSAPAFSLDSNYVYYTRAEKNGAPALYQVPVLGGTSKKLLEVVLGPISFSPDGKRFAFTRRYASQGEDALMTANADGTGEQKLAARTFPDYFMSGTAWSPDGKTIACPMGGFSGGFYTGVAVIQVADGAQKTLTSNKSDFLGKVAWLSDGSGIITTAAAQWGSPYQIWQISYPKGEAHTITNDLNDYSSASLNADSSTLVTVLSESTSNIWVTPPGERDNIRQLTSGKANGEPGASWTPDGRIVYISHAGGNTDIWIMDADGRNQKQLTDDASNRLGSLSATPDGRYIVFTSTRSGTFQLWRIDIDGSNLKQLTTSTGGWQPHCSPDGKWVVYHSFGSSGFIIWKVSIDGGEPVQVTDKFASFPAVSPDGKLIACYLRDPQTRVKKIALLPFEGGDPVRSLDLPQTADAGQSVRWTPDGRAVTYIDTRGLVSNIWLQPIDGSPRRQLTNFKTDRIFSFDWSRDGKLVCSRGVIDSDVVLIKDFR